MMTQILFLVLIVVGMYNGFYADRCRANLTLDSPTTRCQMQPPRKLRRHTTAA